MSGIEQIRQAGQSVWYDNVDRKLLDSGEMAALIEQGVSGVTSNPTIFERAITSSDAYDSDILVGARAGKSINQIYDEMVFADIRRVADLLLPVYTATNHSDGYVSIEVPPNLCRDTAATVREGHRLFRAINKPNIMVKVPATQEGIPAIKELIQEGINVNATLIFSVKMYEKVMNAYLSGLESRLDNRLSMDVVSVASFFVSRLDTFVDRLIYESDLDNEFLGQAGIANARVAYSLFEKQFSSSRFERLEDMGAKVQKPLWASTGVKNPNYPELMYVSSLIGPHIVNTMPPKTLDAVMKSDQDFTQTVDSNLKESEQVLHLLESAGVSLENVTSQLLLQGLDAFDNSFNSLLENLKEKSRYLQRTVR